MGPSTIANCNRTSITTVHLPTFHTPFVRLFRCFNFSYTLYDPATITVRINNSGSDDLWPWGIISRPESICWKMILPDPKWEKQKLATPKSNNGSTEEMKKKPVVGHIVPKQCKRKSMQEIGSTNRNISPVLGSGDADESKSMRVFIFIARARKALWSGFCSF